MWGITPDHAIPSSPPFVRAAYERNKSTCACRMARTVGRRAKEYGLSGHLCSRGRRHVRCTSCRYLAVVGILAELLVESLLVPSARRHLVRRISKHDMYKCHSMVSIVYMDRLAALHHVDMGMSTMSQHDQVQGC